MATQDVTAALEFAGALKGDRQPWNPLYQETADYLLPVRAAFTQELVKGDNRFDFLHDDTGPWALDQFANGLHSMLTSPLTRWFDMQIRDPEMRRDPDLLEWKDAATSTLYDLFNNSESSFHPAVQEVYTDIGAFGYGTLFSEWSEEDGAILYQARFPGEIFLHEDMFGRINGLARAFKLKADQFVEAFGAEKLPAADREPFRQGKLKREYEITHIVLPREHPLMRRFEIKNRSFQFGSVRVCRQVPDEPLAVGGFRSFPFHIGRWAKRTGEVYSSSPGIVALPSVRRANAIQQDLVKIVNRWADPPTQGPDDEFLAPYDLSPGAQNYYRPGTPDRVEAINGVMGDINPAVGMVQGIQESIQRAFFVDAFLTTVDSNGQNVKATFVMQRRNERFRQLASMLSRVERELLSSVVVRTFDLAQEHNLIPPAPTDAEIEIEFLSPITRAQRSEILDGLNQAVELAAMGAQFDPAVMSAFRWPNIIGDAGRDIFALPARWFASEEEINESREQQAQEQQAAQQSEVVRNQAAAFKDVATSVTGGNAA